MTRDQVSTAHPDGEKIFYELSCRPSLCLEWWDGYKLIHTYRVGLTLVENKVLSLLQVARCLRKDVEILLAIWTQPTELLLVLFPPRPYGPP